MGLEAGAEAPSAARPRAEPSPPVPAAHPVPAARAVNAAAILIVHDFPDAMGHHPASKGNSKCGQKARQLMCREYHL
ncbi:hypothetical protein GCM10017600_63210 [Streptosporangium carneum]|uniref:Uncharacterized protein n=1 Tax=Streptosporangium carneum TaxID=47481 RepID=A0A9W6MG41_9ACTN|nr:hypothetical protein GCM10017600_63210 [Streptosporangium carneum]